ncbi:PREDICTED: probable nucleoporin Nup58 isoform X2 [Papilio xuthus]|uniref:Probable nucleoporin Nup58 isoform X2 n=1 Tax=Papilio xuthus TaxID=66420 RepID=A0AAJ6ZFM7_PAPXU|nr:PREDICTED: probable nucleoporin Nup58 isoform X2 [Papilio xuthus]
MSFSFGTPSSAPANSSLSSGFNFGGNKPATPGFGLTATTQASTGLFGNTSATPAFGSTSGFGASTPAFGATATPSFGATSAAPAFGSTATPAFGTSAAAPAFGSTAAPAFGTASATPAFGATATAPAFGATATPAFGASTSAPAFGATTTPAFGTAGASAFGATSTPAFGTTGLGAGSLNFGAGTATTSASTGLSFGTPATKTGLGGFGFGTTTTTQTGLGLFNTSTTTTAAGNFATPSLGLGGAATSTFGATNTTGDGKSEPPKQTKLPNELSTLVDTFKEFVKKQKSLSSEVMRLSIKPLHKVGREAETTLRAALALRGETNKARAQSRRLRTAAADALAAAEAAARDPPGSELEGSAPPKYIKDLICELEQQLITFRRQMDVADKQMQAAPKLLTEQELTLGIRRMHESLVALAGRLQTVHTQVEAQKEQYLNLRKYVLKDPTNVFDTPSASASLDQILHDAEVSRKKLKPNTLQDISLGLGSAVLSDPRAALGNIQQLAGPTPFTYLGTAVSPFPTADGTGNWQPQQQNNFSSSLNFNSFGTVAQNDSSFQLQKPPGKRGKQ